MQGKLKVMGNTNSVHSGGEMHVHAERGHSSDFSSEESFPASNTFIILQLFQTIGTKCLICGMGEEQYQNSKNGIFLQEPHGVTSQKTPFFLVTAVKTSNLISEFVWKHQ
jgi:hypothetical protein